MQVFTLPNDGGAVAVPIRRRSMPATPSQLRNRRFAHWLHAVEVGTYDPATNKIRRHTIGELARLWGLPKSTIRDGLDSARKLRNLVRETAAGE